MGSVILKWAFSILVEKIVKISSSKWLELIALVASFETSNLDYDTRYNRTVAFLKENFKIEKQSTLNFAVELALQFVKKFVVVR